MNSRHVRCLGIALLTTWLLVSGREIAGSQLASQRDSVTSASELCAIGEGLLKKGRTFERAIRYFTEAKRLEPLNFRIHLGLGCANACRAASLADAASRLQQFATDMEKYQKNLSTWQVAQ